MSQLSEPVEAPFRPLRRLSGGAEAEIHVGEAVREGPWGRPGSRVALRLPREEASPWELEAFIETSRQALSVEHPGLAGGFWVGFIDLAGRTRPALALELVEGRTLDGWLDEAGVLPEPVVRELADQILLALGALHAAGLAHGDLHAGNVLVDAHHRVRLIDWGGAPVRGETESSASSDLRSLGALLFQLLTGEGRRAARLREGASAAEPIPRVSAYKVEVSPELDALVSDLCLQDSEQGADSAVAALARLREQASRPRHRERSEPVGRDQELDDLRSGARAAARGTGGLVLLHGEAGIGKTCLAEALAASAENCAVVRLETVHGSHGPSPLARALLECLDGPVVELLMELLGLERPAADAVAAFLEERTPSTNGRRGPELAAQLLRLALALKARARHVWILEDLHLYQGELREISLQLAEALVDAGAFVVMTARTGPDELALPPTLTDGLRVLPLGRLEWRDAHGLARRALPSADSEVIARVVERGEGHPLFLLGLAELAQDGRLDAETIPGSVHELVLQLLDRRPRDERRSLQVAAILGQRFRPGLLARLLDRPRLEVLEQLGRAVALIGWTGAEARFRHQLVHEALLQSHSEVARRNWHRACASVLEKDAQSDLETRVAFVHHGVRGRDVERIAPHLAEVAQRLTDTGRDQEALALTESALTELSADRRALRARLHLVRSHAFARVRPEEEDHELGLGLQAANAAGEESLVDRLRVGMARSWTRAGRLGEAKALLRALVESARGAADEELEANASGQLAQVHADLREMEDALRLLRRQLAIAQRLGDEVMTLRAMGTLGSCHVMKREFDHALAVNERALALARRLGDARTESTILANTGGCLHELGRLADACAAFDRAVELAESMGARRQQYHLLTQLIVYRIDCAELAEAERAAKTSLELARRLQSPLREAVALVNLGCLRTISGLPDEASRDLAVARDVASSLGADFVQQHVEGAEAELAWHGGRSAESLAAARRALDLAERHQPAQRDTAHLGLVRALVDLGRIDEARQHLEARSADDTAGRAWRALLDGASFPEIGEAKGLGLLELYWLRFRADGSGKGAAAGVQHLEKLAAGFPPERQELMRRRNRMGRELLEGAVS